MRKVINILPYFSFFAFILVSFLPAFIFIVSDYKSED